MKSLAIMYIGAVMFGIAWCADFKLTVRHEVALTCLECGEALFETETGGMK